MPANGLAAVPPRPEWVTYLSASGSIVESAEGVIPDAGNTLFFEVLKPVAERRHSVGRREFYLAVEALQAASGRLGSFYKIFTTCE